MAPVSALPPAMAAMPAPAAAPRADPLKVPCSVEDIFVHPKTEVMANAITANFKIFILHSL
jgi:hypothetical protein